MLLVDSRQHSRGNLYNSNAIKALSVLVLLGFVSIPGYRNRFLVDARCPRLIPRQTLQLHLSLSISDTITSSGEVGWNARFIVSFERNFILRIYEAYSWAFKLLSTFVVNINFKLRKNFFCKIFSFFNKRDKPLQRIFKLESLLEGLAQRINQLALATDCGP